MAGILYSAPSRLIGHRLKVRLYSDRLDCYLAGSPVMTLARGTRSPINGRGRVIDYRHFVEKLKRKPQAFKGLVFRDALFLREAYRRTLEELELRLTQRQACQASFPASWVTPSGFFSTEVERLIARAPCSSGCRVKTCIVLSTRLPDIEADLRSPR